MTTGLKIILVIVALVVVAFGVAFGVSRYLVSKLDGTGGVTAPQEHTLQYSSEEGITFHYPDTYTISSYTAGEAGAEWDVLVFLPKGYTAPANGEGPATIALSVFDNPKNLSAEEWVKSDTRSNWQLTVDDRASRAEVVGGEPALWYHHTGLYETDAVAVAHGGKIYLFSVGWLGPQDQVRADFNNLIDTVQFN